VRLSLVLGSTAVCLVTIALATSVFGLSFGRAALLAPVFVGSVGAVAALVVLWVKAAFDSVRSGG
jgi:hypothetical protein